jgi:hypothetical protein
LTADVERLSVLVVMTDERDTPVDLRPDAGLTPADRSKS